VSSVESFCRLFPRSSCPRLANAASSQLPENSPICTARHVLLDRIRPVIRKEFTLRLFRADIATARWMRLLLSRCAEIADCATIFFNAFPRFDYNVTALKSRTRVLKQRTQLRLKFVRVLAATRQIKTVKSLHPIPFDGTLFIRDLWGSEVFVVRDLTAVKRPSNSKSAI
jgi:hypothetical protein